ncbi:hypothetical protein Taro_004316 [Colocasia esculenta]|uniref:Uncharacterized protein n=1 Tax=Colocasia esculenta TaxID=4460 RepID=A0A843THV3_COLES|nr:hypothetical protein [Colocasia esculenta]
MAATVGVKEGGLVDVAVGVVGVSWEMTRSWPIRAHHRRPIELLVEVAEPIGGLELQDVVAWGCGLCQGHLPAAAVAVVVVVAGTIAGRAGTVVVAVAVVVVVAAVVAAVASTIAVVVSDPAGLSISYIMSLNWKHFDMLWPGWRWYTQYIVWSAAIFQFGFSGGSVRAFKDIRAAKTSANDLGRGGYWALLGPLGFLGA